MQVSSTPPSEEFCAELTRCLPHLRSFARFLCRREDQAEDLVQDTVVRALVAAHQFQPGTNLKAWIFTIMHNQNISNFRRLRPVADISEITDHPSLRAAPNQLDHLVLQDLDRAIQKLPAVQRKALYLVAVHGLSYEDAAQICKCAVGTIKSRVGRARAALHEMLMGEDEHVSPAPAGGDAVNVTPDDRGAEGKGRKKCVSPRDTTHHATLRPALNPSAAEPLARRSP